MLALGAVLAVVRRQLPPAFNRRGWHAYWKKTRYSNDKAKTRLGWTPTGADRRGTRGATSRAAARTGRMLKVASSAAARSPMPTRRRSRGSGLRDRRRLRSRAADGAAALRGFRSAALQPICPTLLERARPDVVHITTPPESHFELAQTVPRAWLPRLRREARSRSTRVKPQTLVALATERSLKLTVGHDDQFSHVARRMRTSRPERVSGRPTGAHGELLLLRPRGTRLRDAPFWATSSIGCAGYQASCCTTSSVTASRGSPSF